MFCAYNFQVGSKRKRVFETDEMSKGAVKARQILEAFVALPLETMDKTQAWQEVRKLKDNLEKDAQHCHWLQKFQLKKGVCWQGTHAGHVNFEELLDV